MVDTALSTFLSMELLTPKGIVDAARAFWAFIGPGGTLHPAYFLEHKGHLVVEGLLLVLILALLFQKRKSVPRPEEPLTEREVDQLCQEWQPEPLVPEAPPEAVIMPHVITGTDGTYATVNGQRVLNLASTNFLGLTGDADIKACGKRAIDKYGVGSCGPRGFYGTIDVHLHLEEHIAKFLGMEGGIIYSYDTATVASIIPAFVTRQDVVIVDELCSYPIQSGCVVSRSRVLKFKHNDMKDLERILEAYAAEERANKRKPLCRKFIVVEAVYANTSDIAPLKEIVALKDRYKWRLVLEETYSFGVLGSTGRGLTEHCGLQPAVVDLLCGSMGAALGSVGGWCAGKWELTDHQRLAGSGYCFSASLPPYLAASALSVLEHIESEGPQGVLPRVRKAVGALRKEARKVPGLKLCGDNDVAPLLHLALTKPSGDHAVDTATLQRVADHLLDQSHVLVAVSRYSSLDWKRPPPTLKLFANALLGDEEVTAIGSALRSAAAHVL